LIWFVSCWAETNRALFDFAAGESEMVSGFNIEYGGGRSRNDFWAQYASILFMRLLFCVIFCYCVFSKQNGHVTHQDQPSKDYPHPLHTSSKRS